MKVYTYTGFAVQKKKNKVPKKPLTWDEGARRIVKGSAIGMGIGAAAGGVLSAIQFKKLVKRLMETNPHLTKEQAEDIVRKKHSIGAGIASGLSTGMTVGGIVGFMKNDKQDHDYNKAHKKGK